MKDFWEFIRSLETRFPNEPRSTIANWARAYADLVAEEEYRKWQTAPHKVAQFPIFGNW